MVVLGLRKGLGVFVIVREAGEMTIAQRFSAGSASTNYARAREVGDRILQNRER